MNGWQEKRFLRHWRRLHVKSWQLVLLLVAGVLCTVFLLRQNNLRMVALREAVVAADKNGADVTGALERLNYHVFHHMNTKIVRPVELVNTYNRQAQAVIEAANKNSGRDVYAEATAACERRGIPLASIAQCAAEYAVTNNPGVGPQQIVLPDKNRFIYSFASPASRRKLIFNIFPIEPLVYGQYAQEINQIGNFPAQIGSIFISGHLEGFLHNFLYLGD